jgi:tRNA(Ile)-lysidine synthase
MTLRKMPFDKDRLMATLQRLPSAGTYWVGFSGGADSTALLFALLELKPALNAAIKAVHINHGLHAGSDAWQSHCEQVCAELGLSLVSKSVDVQRNSSSGLEAEARRMRYEIVEDLLEQGDLFLTAHHRDDQAETLLLNLVRGSGVDGLAGMPETRKLGKGLLARPLLEHSMRSLRHYLEERNLEWLEDPSNQDRSYDRNFVRHQLVPELERRWPGASGRLAKSAGLCREASSTLAMWADEILEKPHFHERILELSGLNLQGTRIRLILRRWLHLNGAPPIPTRVLRELCEQSSQASMGNRVCVEWQGWVIHLFQNRFWLQEASEITACPDIGWDHPGPLDLGSGIGSLEIHPSARLPMHGVRVRARKGGERILLTSSGKHKDVKDILREAGIPPWLRRSIPILQTTDNILAVGDMVINPDLSSWLAEDQSSLLWRPSDPLLKLVHRQSNRQAVDHAETLG